MKKLLLGAAVAAALFGGAANAAITFNANGTPDTATMADTATLYLSGSSALKELVERSLLDTSVNSVCTGTVTKYGDAPKDSNQHAYLCQLNTANTKIAAYVAATSLHNLMIFKRDAGGSLKGVVPVTNSLSIEFLKTDAAQICVSAADSNFTTRWSCNYADNTAATPNNTTTIPTFGVADVSTNLFTTASENAPTGTPVFTAGYKVTPGVAVAFGVVATLKLRNALQEAQFGVGDACVGSETEACMPNMNRNLLADIFAAYPKPTAPMVLPVKGAGKIASWTQLKVGATDLFNNASVAYKPTGGTVAGSTPAKVHLCTRTIGSGTKATFGAKILNTVCSSSGNNVVQSADWRGSSESTQTDFVATAITEAAVRPLVHAMSSGGDLEECMTELDSGLTQDAGAFNPGAGAYGVRWALGFHSLDKNAGLAPSKAFRFIKIDGVAPTLANIASGKYPDWAESIYTYRSTTDATAPLTGNELNLVKEVISSFTKPTVMSAVNTAVGTHSFGTSGFLAIPTATNPALANGSVDLAKPVNPLSYAIFNGTGASATNDCRNALIYSNGTSAATSNNAQGVVLVP